MMDKLFERDKQISIFHNFFLEVQNNPHTFLNLRHLYVRRKSVVVKIYSGQKNRLSFDWQLSEIYERSET